MVSARIKWKDSGQEENVIISLTLGYVENSKKDNEVFFYCDGEKELKNLMKKDNGEDFVVLKYHKI